MTHVEFKKGRVALSILGVKGHHLSACSHSREVGAHNGMAGGDNYPPVYLVKSQIDVSVSSGRLSDCVIISGNPPPPLMLVLDQNKATWSTVNHWPSVVNTMIFRLIHSSYPYKS